MYQLYPKQVEIFQARALEKNIRKIEAHLLKIFPSIMQNLEEEDRLEFIRLGVRRAKPYEITCQRGIALYCGTMVRLGSFFDESAVYESLMKVLKKPIGSSYFKAKRLSEEAFEMYIDHYGAHGEYVLDRSIIADKATLAQQLNISSQQTYTEITEHLTKLICPRRYASMSIKHKQLFYHQVESIRPSNVVETTGMGVFFMTNLLLGYRYLDDPLYVQVSRREKSHNRDKNNSNSPRYLYHALSEASVLNIV